MPQLWPLPLSSVFFHMAARWAVQWQLSSSQAASFRCLRDMGQLLRDMQKLVSPPSLSARQSLQPGLPLAISAEGTEAERLECRAWAIWSVLVLLVLSFWGGSLLRDQALLHPEHADAGFFVLAALGFAAASCTLAGGSQILELRRRKRDIENAAEEAQSRAAEAVCLLDGERKLTERERQVMKALALGKTRAEAAQELGISVSSVGTYRSRACQKLGLASGFDAREMLADAMAADGQARSSASAADRLLMAALSALLAAAAAAGFVPALQKGAALTFRPLAAAFLLAWLAARCAEGTDAGQQGRRADALYRMLLLGEAVLALRLCVDEASPGALLAALGSCILLADALRKSCMGVPLAFGEAVPLAAGLLFILLLGTRGPTEAGYLSLGAFELSLEAIRLSGSTFSCLLLAGLLAFRHLWKIGSTEEPGPAGTELDRAILYLEGRGTSELAAAILARTAAGQDAAMIADALHVARGTVASARFRGYALLGVRSASELRQLLARDVGFGGSGPNAASTRDAHATMHPAKWARQSRDSQES